MADRIDPYYGKLTESSGPIGFIMGEEADFDITLHNDVDRLRVALDLDHVSSTFGEIEITKQIELSIDFMSEHGRGAYINELERLFKEKLDTVVFLTIQKRAEILRLFMEMLEDSLDKALA